MQVHERCLSSSLSLLLLLLFFASSVFFLFSRILVVDVGMECPRRVSLSLPTGG